MPAPGHKLFDSALAVAIGVVVGVIALIAIAVGLSNFSDEMSDDPVGTIAPYVLVAVLVGGALLWNRHSRAKRAREEAARQSEQKPFRWPTDS